MKNLLLLLHLCLAIGTPVYADSLKPFNANYVVAMDKEVIVNTTISLRKTNGNTWEYRSFSKPTGWFASIMGLSVTETSTLQNQDDRLRVTDYRYDRTGKSKHVHLKFDWQNMSVTNSINGDQWTMPVPEGTTDKLSIILVLMTHLKKQSADASFPVADGGRLKYYDFTIAAKELLKTSIGNINSIKIHRNKRGRSDKTTTLWLAPDLDFLLLKMEKQDNNGKIITLKIQSYNQGAPMPLAK